jgi:hypothetical protein
MGVYRLSIIDDYDFFSSLFEEFSNTVWAVDLSFLQCIIDILIEDDDQFSFVLLMDEVLRFGELLASYRTSYS